ncbi:chalcone isomerase family protein [Mesonia aestuariivivens]|uniref:Chalcone isomerase family protein n=1 Tax=Mesonia aestuariivivens TaxID=2796128 RepID=A0ABS6W475_9FLAO|nr:chalcone isomerase family protein [Mesonia aestuariivivens]MBW2962524.1 chalcone isomerase family protein [Mesonia aestuariivivens]
MKKVLLVLMVFCVIGFTQAQKEVAGITIPVQENFGEYNLTLNGAGVREKLWIDLYAGALYLSSASSDANKILNSEEAMAVKLHIVSNLISSKKMIDAVEEGFENSTNGNTAPLKSKIEKFITFFKEEINKGDVFDITYQPEKGVVSYKNGKEKGTIEGMEFKKALFGIWLSNKPADDDLKEAMLGLD